MLKSSVPILMPQIVTSMVPGAHQWGGQKGFLSAGAQLQCAKQAANECDQEQRVGTELR